MNRTPKPCAWASNGFHSLGFFWQSGLPAVCTRHPLYVPISLPCRILRDTIARNMTCFDWGRIAVAVQEGLNQALDFKQLIQNGFYPAADAADDLFHLASQFGDGAVQILCSGGLFGAIRVDCLLKEKRTFTWNYGAGTQLEFDATQRSIRCFNGHTPRQLEVSGQVSLLILIMRPSLLPDKYRANIEQSFYLLDESYPIPGAVAICNQMMQAPCEPGSELYYEAKMKELLYSIYSWYTKGDCARQLAHHERQSLLAVEGYLAQHYTQPLSIDKCSQLACMSRSMLSRLFKSVYGMSMSKYLQTLRIDHAKQLLRTSSYTISEIAHMSGYKRHSSFSIIFKKIVGMSPQEYRNTYP